jgi:hypothetical protein
MPDAVAALFGRIRRPRTVGVRAYRSPKNHAWANASCQPRRSVEPQEDVLACSGDVAGSRGAANPRCVAGARSDPLHDGPIALCQPD